MASQSDNIAKEGFYMEKKEEIIEVTNDTEIEVTSITVSSLIHIIRGKRRGYLECLAFHEDDFA